MKNKLLTRQFIHENIKVNATVSSYPFRTVAPVSTTLTPTTLTNKNTDISKNININTWLNA